MYGKKTRPHDWVSRLCALLAVVVLLSVFGFATAKAQVVTQVPGYLDNSAVSDLGNGPTELRILGGNAQIWSMQSSGTANTSGTGSSTTLILSTTPTTLPCIGCALSGNGFPTTTAITVTAFVGGASTALTMSSGLTISSGTAVAWGAACPASVGSNRVMLLQAGVGADLPLYTTARICGAAQNSPGATYVSFPIGAH